MKSTKKQYLYKIQRKFQKNPELLLQYGFSKFSDESGEEVIYAMPIVLTQTGSIFNYLKRSLEKIYTYATSEERKTDFKDFEFKEILTEKQQKDYELVITDSIRLEFTKAELCCYDNGEGMWCLFINAPDHVQYYNTVTLDEECSEIINKLIEAKVIYKKRNRRI
ncbi:MAG: hypothetical protein K5765_06615 [Clostridia bacterium]|nr:hypothetical protein [Clostridia bacterium]